MIYWIVYSWMHPYKIINKQPFYYSYIFFRYIYHFKNYTVLKLLIEYSNMRDQKHLIVMMKKMRH